MKLVVLYKVDSEYSRKIEAYVKDFQRMYPDKKTDIKDVDSIEGSREAQLYDVTQYPALLVVEDDGGLINIWQGPELPLMGEVYGYLR